MSELEVFGRKGDGFYVNSADNQSMDSVEEMFPDANFDGSVTFKEIQQMLAELGEQIQIGDMVLGDVALRKFIESSRINCCGKPYSEKQARNHLNRASFIQTITGANGKQIRYSLVNSLATYVDEKHHYGNEQHCLSLERARASR